MPTTEQKKVAFLTRAEGGAIRIFSGSLAVEFNAGSGDGRYNVSFGEYLPELDWKFVDSFEVTNGGAYLSGSDYANYPVYEIPNGRYGVYYLPDHFCVKIKLFD